MKLLAINNYHYGRGGAETVFLEEGRQLRDLGWDVAQFCMQHPRNLPSAWERFFVEEIEFGHSYSLAGKLKRAPKVVWSTEARVKLGALLDAFRPDVAHAHNIYNHISPSILPLLKERGVPTFLTLHDLKIACPAYNMLSNGEICERCKGGNLRQVVLRRCIKGSTVLSALVYAEARLHATLKTYERSVHRFIVPSRFYVDKLVEWGFPGEKMVHLPNFVDSSKEFPAAQVGRSFLFFGRLSREKGVATLVRAAAAAGVPLTVVGTGPQEAELRELAGRIGADVTFAGFLRGRDLHEQIAAARAIVLPSEWYENAPMSILEAYAASKVVLGADIGGIPELIREGQTGFLFRSGNVESLVASLQAIRDLPDGRLAEMGRFGREWVHTDFSSSAHMKRLTAIYADAIA